MRRRIKVGGEGKGRKEGREYDQKRENKGYVGK